MIFVALSNARCKAARALWELDLGRTLGLDLGRVDWAIDQKSRDDIAHLIPISIGVIRAQRECPVVARQCFIESLQLVQNNATIIQCVDTVWMGPRGAVYLANRLSIIPMLIKNDTEQSK